MAAEAVQGLPGAAVWARSGGGVRRANAKEARSFISSSLEPDQFDLRGPFQDGRLVAVLPVGGVLDLGLEVVAESARGDGGCAVLGLAAEGEGGAPNQGLLVR